MDHDLKRFPRLLARLLTGTTLPTDCSVKGCITVWTAAHLGRCHIMVHICSCMIYCCLNGPV